MMYSYVTLEQIRIIIYVDENKTKQGEEKQYDCYWFNNESKIFK